MPNLQGGLLKNLACAEACQLLYGLGRQRVVWYSLALCLRQRLVRQVWHSALVSQLKPMKPLGLRLGRFYLPVPTCYMASFGLTTFLQLYSTEGSTLAAVPIDGNAFNIFC